MDEFEEWWYANWGLFCGTGFETKDASRMAWHARDAEIELLRARVAELDGVIGEISKERRRQRDLWSQEHDDGHDDGAIAKAAAAYAIYQFEGFIPSFMPTWIKPRGHRQNLIRAAAMLVAEIERVDRAAKVLGEK